MVELMYQSQEKTPLVSGHALHSYSHAPHESKSCAYVSKKYTRLSSTTLTPSESVKTISYSLSKAGGLKLVDVVSSCRELLQPAFRHFPKSDQALLNPVYQGG